MQQGDMPVKDPANMTPAERLNWLIRDLHAPTVLNTKAKRLRELLQREWAALNSVVDSALGNPLSAVPLPMPDAAVAAVAPPPQAAPLQPGPAFGSVSWLILQYRTDPRSPYQKISFATKQNYEANLNRWESECGEIQLSALKHQDIDALYAGWVAKGTLHVGHALMTMLRVMVHFGASVLEDNQCERLSVVLHNMNFPMPPKRSGELTLQQAKDIIAAAVERRYLSVAMAQAFQSSLRAHQKDVIGEWVPLSEPGESKLERHGLKWIRGLRWEEIDSNMILRRPAINGRKALVVDLNQLPLVAAEIARMPYKPNEGPVVVYEKSHLPYEAHQFRRLWRACANDAGIPTTVRNMDSRAGGPKAKAGAADDGAADEIPGADIQQEDLAFVVRH